MFYGLWHADQTVHWHCNCRAHRSTYLVVRHFSCKLPIRREEVGKDSSACFMACDSCRSSSTALSAATDTSWQVITYRDIHQQVVTYFGHKLTSCYLPRHSPTSRYRTYLRMEKTAIAKSLKHPKCKAGRAMLVEVKTQVRHLSSSFILPTTSLFAKFSRSLGCCI